MIMNTQIVSNTAAPVFINKIPSYTKFVSYKIVNSGEIKIYYWMKDIVCKYNFFDPQKRDLDFYGVKTEDGKPVPFYGYGNAFCPRNGRPDTLEIIEKEAEKIKLEHIVFSCFATANFSTVTQKPTDIIRFYGVEFDLPENSKHIRATNRYGLPNTSNGIPCWGSRSDISGHYDPHNLYDFRSGTMSGKINTFINTTFNNDYVTLGSWVELIEKHKNYQKIYQNSFSSNVLFSADDGYDAFLSLSFTMNPVAYFRMYAAGFRPVSTEEQFMLIPLKSGSMEYDGNTYYGYFTKEDALGKSWFVNNTGHLLGQVDG